MQYPDGKEVSCTYGKSGGRTGIIYPDGKRVEYLYVEELRLSGLDDGNGMIRYRYDEAGRLSRKTFQNGMETSYLYNASGYLAELAHRDREGILDRYTYRYDLTGNKTAIGKQRRGLPEESGTYAYGYDALGRLSSVSKDGQSLRTYEYDAFGNRSLLREGGRETSYVYNALNQLLSRADAVDEETYTYDRRGNLSLITENGALKNSYTYGAINRLEQAENGNGEAVSYTYNGLGHRVGKRIGPETKIQYTIDLTRSYHNLLQKEEGEKIQTFLWDGNTVGMWEETGKNGAAYGEAFRYYLQDELGSPIRLLSESGEPEESYGYDEFGQDLYGNQGIVQPFGYTGYQADRTAGTYYAQAREYRAELGRFAAVDAVKGFVIAPYSLNEYGYCWGNPIVFLDLNGAWPEWAENAVKVGATLLFVAAAVGITVATFGTGAGVVVAAAAAIGGTVGGIDAMQSGGNAADGIMRGGTLATTAAVSAVASPIGAGLGLFCQLSTDLVRDEISSPEAYTGAMLGGAVGMSTGNAGIGAAVSTATGEALENVNGVRGHKLTDILVDTAFTGAIAAGVHKFIPMIEFDMDYYLKKY